MAGTLRYQITMEKYQATQSFCFYKPASECPHSKSGMNGSTLQRDCFVTQTGYIQAAKEEK